MCKPRRAGKKTRPQTAVWEREKKTQDRMTGPPAALIIKTKREPGMKKKNTPHTGHK